MQTSITVLNPRMVIMNGRFREGTMGKQGQQQVKRKTSGQQNEIKVVVLGLLGVGKTALIVRFLTKRFIGVYDKSAETKYRFNVMLDDESTTVEMLDSNIQALVGSVESSRSVYVKLNEEAANWADAFVLVYSITSRRSFQSIHEIRKQIIEVRGKPAVPPPMLLVGNKCDLEHLRDVTKDEATKYAQQQNMLFGEISVADSLEGVQRTMQHFLRHVSHLSEKHNRTRLMDKFFPSRASKQNQQHYYHHSDTN